MSRDIAMENQYYPRTFIPTSTPQVQLRFRQETENHEADMRRIQ